MIKLKIDPKLDLVLERTASVKPELIWKAWTTPDLLKQWFCPRPWQTVACEMDLQPGGFFKTVMRSPDGQEFPTTGCYLELIENRKLSWTNALLPGFRPLPSMENGGELYFTAMILLEPNGEGTKYTAIARHRDEADLKRHEQMGFKDGWGACFDQLLEIMSKK